jgi:aminoglycoside phosphotransferase
MITPPTLFDQVAHAFASRYKITPQQAVDAIPPRLREIHDYKLNVSAPEIDDLLAVWGERCKACIRPKVSEEVDRRRLANFRRRYGPNITMEHLPRGKK